MSVLEASVDNLKDSVDKLPQAINDDVKNAISIAMLEVQIKQAEEYKKDSKWKDRTIIGFLISLFIFVLSFLSSMFM